jgi:hypothetical protein
MNRQSRWILSIAAMLFVGTMAHAKDVVLQDGGVVLGTTDTTPIPVATPPVPTDNLPGSNGTTGTQESPEPATLTLLGLGGLGALWKLRRRKAAAV